MDFDSSLGHLVSTWRNSAGLTQQMLGDAVGLDQASISRIESGDRKVDVSLMLHILAATGLSLSEAAASIQALVPTNLSLWSEQ